MTDELLSDLRDRAVRGDGDAKLGLGLRLLTTAGEAAEGAAMIESECEAGSGDAAALLATLEAMGAGRPQSWEKAFDYLQLAAERGSGRARAQLRALARADSEDWRRLRAGIDIAALAAPAAKRPVSERPRIRVLEGFAPAEECEWLIGIARDRLSPARVWDPATGEGRPIRTAPTAPSSSASARWTSSSRRCGRV